MPILNAGTPVLLIDRKHRSWYAVLTLGERTAVKGERLLHDDLIGLEDGATVTTPKGNILDIITAGYADHAVLMKRHATPIYPKDVGPILLFADIYPGAKVLEIGVGSGALTMALLRMVGPTGHVTSYDNQSSSIGRARKNIRALLGGDPENHLIVEADAYVDLQPHAEGLYDRCVMDVPEPAKVIMQLKALLRPGGAVAVYVPHIPQVQEAVKAFYVAKGFTGIDVMEVLERRWVVVDGGARPDHKMQGHTGFLVFARRGGVAVTGYEASEAAESGAEGAEPAEPAGEADGADEADGAGEATAAEHTADVE